MESTEHERRPSEGTEARRLSGDDGTPIRLLGISQDITEQHLAVSAAFRLSSSPGSGARITVDYRG